MPDQSTPSLAMPETATGLRALAAEFDGFIIDVWGVLHDGFKPYPGAVDCLERLKAAGKRTVILSNAPRRATAVISRMREIGIPDGLYDHVLSSGEETWQHLLRRPDPFYAALGRACFFIGPARDRDMLTELGIDPVSELEKAEFILATGPWGWEENAENYEAILQAARVRDLPLICANPDLVVRLGDRLAICAGTLAQRYEALGGRVRWHGKPHRSVYETCFTLLGLPGTRRILAIGDSLRTDIAGANGAGISSLFIAGGIHAEEFEPGPDGMPDPARLAAAIALHRSRPDFVMPHLMW
ncbi:MAG: TIGR01459 family HAD-type hydrolase [Alphaproteobacteria bacterium]|nr:TIGR01459 family HAD-type hydrolase [Alphaproteobacteria bacterium]